jgi:hypothetical protein
MVSLVIVIYDRNMFVVPATGALTLSITTLSVMTLSIMTFRIMTFSITTLSTEG